MSPAVLSKEPPSCCAFFGMELASGFSAVYLLQQYKSDCEVIIVIFSPGCMREVSRCIFSVSMVHYTVDIEMR